MSTSKSIACFVIAGCLAWQIWQATNNSYWGGAVMTLCLFVMTCVDGLCAALSRSEQTK
jgi:hypothetical protein